jgi:hypothetical protein
MTVGHEDQDLWDANKARTVAWVARGRPGAREDLKFPCWHTSFSYRDLIDFGSIVLEASDSDYQGDTLMLLQYGTEYGVLLFGWGSCSGCDALQGCESFEEVAKLRNDLLSQVQWSDSLEGVVELLKKPAGTTHAARLYAAMLRLVHLLDLEKELRYIRLRLDLCL